MPSLAEVFGDTSESTSIALGDLFAPKKKKRSEFKAEAPQIASEPPTFPPLQMHTPLENMNYLREKELATGIPRDFQDINSLRERYKSSLGTPEEDAALIDLQIAERHNAVGSERIASERAKMQAAGMTPEQYRIAETYQYEQEKLGPDARLANLPFMRGMTSGAETLASVPAELALRATSNGDNADQLARARQETAKFNAYADQQQGRALGYVRQGAEVLTKYTPAGAVGAMLPAIGAETLATKQHEGLQSGMSGVESVGYGVLHATKDMLLTAIGGKVAAKLGGRTTEQALGMRGGADLGRASEQTFKEMAKRLAVGTSVELGVEELPQYASEMLIDKFTRSDYRPRSWKEIGNDVVDIVAATVLMQTATAPLDTASPQEQKKIQAAKDFIANPSRINAIKAGLSKIVGRGKDAKVESTVPTQRDRSNVAEAAATAVAKKTAAKSRETADSILDRLSEAHADVADRMAGPTGTPEYATVREHTAEVLTNYLSSQSEPVKRRWGKSPSQKPKSPTGDKELDTWMPTILALHDIGKPDAIAAGDKSLQHAKTIPILEDVLGREGAPEKVIKFAKSLVGNDTIGSVIKGQLSIGDAVSQLKTAAESAGVKPESLESAMNSFYKADAGSYAKLRDGIFSQSGEIADYRYRAYEEAVHGVSRVPWSGEYRGAGVRPRSDKATGDSVYRHSSARDFSQFDASRDRANSNLAGPGAYLLPAGHEQVEAVYRKRAVEGVYGVLKKELGQAKSDDIRAKLKSNQAIDSYIDRAIAKQAMDPANAKRWGIVADALTALKHNSSGLTLHFEFTPKKMLDLGAWKSGGRVLSAAELGEIVSAAKRIKPSFTAPDSKRGVALLQAMQRQIGHAMANRVLQAAGYDSVGFIHPGHRGGSMQHPVVVALDHSAPMRTTPNSAKPVVPSKASAALVAPDIVSPIIARAKDAAASIKKSLVRNFTSQSGRPDIAEKLLVERNQFLGEQAYRTRTLTSDLVRAARKDFGVSVTKRLPDTIGESLQVALQQPDNTAAWNALPTDTAVALRAMRDHIDELSRMAASLPDSSEDLQVTIESNLGSYVTRSYRKYSEKNWTKKALNDPAIMKAFADEVRSESPDATDSDIQTLATILLNQHTLTIGEVTGAAPRTNRYVKVLKQRKEISPGVRKLYGEHTNAIETYARTMESVANTVAQKQYVANLKEDGLASGVFWDDVAKIPPGTNATKFESQVPQLQQLNGLYVDKDISTALQDVYATKDQGGWLYKGYVSAVMSTKAAATVQSLQATVRNLTGNIPIALANGMANPKAMLKSLKMVVGDFEAYDTKKIRGELQKLNGLGLIEDATAAEITKMAGEISTSLESYMSGTGNVSAFKAFTRTMSKTYQSMDAVWKIATYYDYLPQYRDALPDMPQADLERYVANIVRDLTPTYSKAPKASKFWSKMPFMGDFAMFQLESIRTTANRIALTKQEWNSGNPVLRKLAAKRAAGMLAAHAGAVGLAAAMRSLIGIDDDEWEALRNRLAPWQKNSIIVPLPKKPSDGPNIRYIDMGYNDPFGVFHQPIQALLHDGPLEAAKEFAEPFTSEGILTGAIISAARNRDENGYPVASPGASWEEQTKQKLEYVASRFVPGTLRSLERIRRGVAGEKGAGGQSYDTQQEIKGMLFGYKEETLDPRQAETFGYKRLDDEVSQTESAIAKPFSSRATFNPEQAAATYMDAEGERKRRWDKMREYMKQAVVLGDKSPIATAHASCKSSLKDLQRIYAGQYVPYMPSSTTLRAWRAMDDGEQRIQTFMQLRNARLEQLTTPASTAEAAMNPTPVAPETN